MNAAQLLRPGLLEGTTITIASGRGAHEPGDSIAQVVRSACAQLGARVESWEPGEEQRAVDVLVFDGAGAFAAGAAGELPERDAGDEDAREHAGSHTPARGNPRAALDGCLRLAWEATRTVAAGAMLAAARGGRIIYIAPADPAGEHAGAARAGLENLARTLSIEWSRHGLTAVAIAPGASTEPADVAALIAYLASPAGAYFAGCLMDLGALPGTP